MQGRCRINLAGVLDHLATSGGLSFNSLVNNLGTQGKGKTLMQEWKRSLHQGYHFVQAQLRGLVIVSTVMGT